MACCDQRRRREVLCSVLDTYEDANEALQRSMHRLVEPTPPN